MTGLPLDMSPRHARDIGQDTTPGNCTRTFATTPTARPTQPLPARKCPDMRRSNRHHSRRHKRFVFMVDLNGVAD